MKVYLSIPIKAEAQERLEKAGLQIDVNQNIERPQNEDLLNIIKTHDIITIGIFQNLTKEMLAQIKEPKIIATMSIGLDHIDPTFFDNSFVKVVSIRTANALSVAEHILMFMLALSKRAYESNYLAIDYRGHRKYIMENDRPNDVSGKTLGLIGFGNVTKELVRLTKVFNMKVLCYTKNPTKQERLNNKDVEFVGLNKVLGESDFINVSIPLNEETRKLISKEKIALIKKTATFINTSRTEIVDTQALIEYAEDNKTFYVGLDIDIDEHEELFTKYRRNVIVTPHTAGVSKEAIARMDDEIVDNIINLIK